MGTDRNWAERPAQRAQFLDRNRLRDGGCGIVSTAAYLEREHVSGLRPANLQVRLLGEFAVELDGEPIGAFESLRLQRLLAHLVVSPNTAQTRASVAFALWPDSTDAQAHTNLRHLLHDLRRALPGVERYVDITNRSLRWRPDAPARVDVLVFRDGIASDDLESAVTEYGGDFLSACYDDWSLAERDRLRSVAVEALMRLAERAAESGLDGATVEYCRRLLQLEPFHEPSYALLIRTHAKRGDRAAALRAYHVCVDVLERELGVEPDAQTRRLYDEVRTGAFQSRSARVSSVSKAPIAAPPLVAREAAWQTAVATWEEAAAGSARLLLVTGEPGVGKSRLVEELSRRCATAGTPFARTRAYEAAGRAPWAPVVDWLRAGPIRAGIGQLEEARLAELSRLLPELRAERPDLPLPTPAADAAQRYVMLDAVAHALTALPTPVLLVLDDLQWCDADTIDLVGFLLRSAPVASVLIAATARTEEIDSDHPAARLLADLGRHDTLVEVELDRLDTAATAELAGRLLGHDLDTEAAERLYTETEGNPLFVVEAVRAGFPFQPGVGLSGTVQAMINARLAQLSVEARRLVEVAATVGRAFTVDVLGSASGMSEDDMVGALDELWRRRIVREQGGAYDFAHDKIREVAHDTISPARRRRLHASVGAALADMHAADAGPVSAQLAAHYERAGLPVESIAAHRRAASHALSLFALDDAARSLRRALSLMEQLPAGPARDEMELDLRIELGVPLTAREGYGSAATEDSYQRALALSRRLGRPPPPPVLRGLGLAALMSCRFDTSTGFGTALLAEGVDDPIAATEGHYLLGVSAFWRGELASACDHLLAAIDGYRPDLGPEHLARYAQDPKAICLIRLAVTKLWRGEPDCAVALAEEALAFAEALGDPTTTGYVMAYAALAAAEAGDLTRVGLLLDAGDEVWTAQGLRLFGTIGGALRGWADALSGRGLTGIQDAVGRWRNGPQPLHLTHSLSLLARAHHLAGNPAAGRAAIAEGLEWTARHDQRYLEAELWRIDGELLVLQGDLPGAFVAIKRALEVAVNQGAHWLELRAACSLARHAPGPVAFQHLEIAHRSIVGGVNTPEMRTAAVLLGGYR
jgi:DNA-binding SARP family transcriptional activator